MLLVGLAVALMTGAAVKPAPADSPQPVDIDLGGKVILRVRTSRGGLTPKQRANIITDRLTRILAVPDITPADVVIYYVPPNSPVIYVLGRKLVVVDRAAVTAAGGDALGLATVWAKSLQQILPFVDVRLPDEHEPVISPDPPLLVTDDMNAVGGSVGNVYFRDAVVMQLLGVQPDGLTAAEESDLVSARLSLAVHNAGPIGPDGVRVVVDDPPGGNGLAPDATVPDEESKATPPEPSPWHGEGESDSLRTLSPPTPSSEGSVAPTPSGKADAGIPLSNERASVFVGNQEIVSVDAAEAVAAGADSPSALAQTWAANIRASLGLTSTASTP